MIQFSLLGVPIRILPWHWITMAFIGGGFRLSSTSELPLLLLFMIAGFLSVLAHEMGHALVGRHYGGGSAHITLSFLGGYTEFYNNRYHRRFSKCAMIAAGCMVNLCLVLLAFIFLFFMNGMQIETTLLMGKILVLGAQYSGQFFAKGGFIPESQILAYGFLGALTWTSFWWGLLNLIPIFPLDGGQLLDQFARSHKTTYKVGLVCASAFAIWGFSVNQIFLAVFMVFFAFENYKLLKNARY